MENNDYKTINKATWNQKVAVHVESDFYQNKSFLEGRSTLNEIELELLGDITDKKILHLQCHFGQDSLSMSRMGAYVVGVDISDKAIEKATEFSVQLGLNAQFICSDIYETPNLIDDKFDIVFTSYGTIGWLPDLDRWAEIIHHFLKPNGRLIMADFHPVVWMYDTNFSKVEYSYFNTKPIVEEETGTYADRNSGMTTKTITWNHPLSELLTSLIQKGLRIDQFREYDYSPYNCFNDTEEFETGKFRIKKFENKIPLVYSLLCTKPE